MTQLKIIKKELNKIKVLKRSGKIIKFGFDFAKNQMVKEQKLKKKLQIIMLMTK